MKDENRYVATAALQMAGNGIANIFSFILFLTSCPM